MKNRLISISILIVILSDVTTGQVTEAEKKLRSQSSDTIQGWKTGGVISASLAQTSLKNWAAGGENSLALNGSLNLFADFKKGSTVWDNSLGIGYGFIKQGKNSIPMKTDDKIDFISIYGKKASKNFYWAALLNFKTQMAAGYNYPNDSVKISDFFAPAYFVLAVGMEYKPNAYFSAFLAPLTAKFTFISNDTLSKHGAFGVKPGEHLLSEFGGYLRIIYTKNDFKSELLKNVSFTTKADLFSNYLKDPQNIVVNWETLLAFKVNKFISVNFNTILIYDDKIKINVDRYHDGIHEIVAGPRIQFKEILGVGFAYNF